MPNTRRDTRRVGIAAAALAGAYGVTIFVPVPWVARLVFAAGLAIIALGIAVFAPLPLWKEAEERKRLAARGMIGVALVIAVAVTVIRFVRV